MITLISTLICLLAEVHLLMSRQRSVHHTLLVWHSYRADLNFCHLTIERFDLIELLPIFGIKGIFCSAAPGRLYIFLDCLKSGDQLNKLCLSGLHPGQGIL